MNIMKKLNVKKFKKQTKKLKEINGQLVNRKEQSQLLEVRVNQEVIKRILKYKLKRKLKDQIKTFYIHND